ncbi:MAG: AbrB family transcriptional regulator [Methylobacteriaceae bacterium]|nr:AbrB family transcriptional regulator [Methylobacteriaceae bacterium]
MRSIPSWAGLGGLSLALTLALQAARLPASLLLGPMLAGIALGVTGIRIRVPRPAFLAAQAAVGCLIAHSITAGIVASVLQDWVAMLLVGLSTIVSAAMVAWALGRSGRLPGTTAAWGASPGGASAMVAMAEEFGADARIVAFMQYARVACVVLTASAVARVAMGDAAGATPALPALPAPFDFGGFVLTIAVAAAGIALASALRVPAAGLLGPLLLGSVLHAADLATMTLPDPVLALSYAAIGWYVGLRFTRETLALVWRALPHMLAATFAMIALGAGSALLLVRLRHTDPLTAFLATTPGGIDSVAIIAVGSGTDVPFVLALQTLRVLLVVVTGAPVARLVARLSARQTG